MKTFKDLKFQDRTDGIGGKRAVEDLGNNFAVSVLLGGEGMYTNGIDSYELAIFYKEVLVYGLGNDDVFGWISADKVSEIMIKLQTLNEKEQKKFDAEYERVIKENEEEEKRAEEIYEKIKKRMGWKN